MNVKVATFEWLILLVLTALTFGLAEAGLSGGEVLIPVLAATLVKGRIIINSYMGMRRVIAPWRWVVLGWLLLVVGLIAYAFYIASN